MSDYKVNENGTSAPNVEFLVGNTGGPVGPNSSFEIDVIGAGSITVTGNPGTHTLTISDGAGAYAQQSVYVNAQTGSDSQGDGSPDNPFATVSHALGTISDNSFNKPYTIYAMGFFAESIALKPWISIQGDGNFTSTFTGATLDASFSTVSGPSINLNAVSFSTLSLVFTATGGNGATVVLTNCLVGAATVLTGRNASDFFTLIGCTHISASTFTDALVNTNACFFTGVTSAAVASINPVSWTSFGDSVGSITQTNAAAGNTVTIRGSYVNGALSCTASTFIYDATSYPQGGITLASGGTATQYISSPGKIPHTSVTGATYTVLGSDYYLACNRAGTIALTFPTATGSGRVIIIKDVSGMAALNNITTTSSGATFDGVATLTLNTNYGIVICTDTATNIWSLS